MDAIEIELPGAHVRFTGRPGGVSRPPYGTLDLSLRVGDEPGDVAENRRRAADGRPLASLHQVHGADVLTAPAEGGEVGCGDGLVTDDPGLALLVTTADCLPVALAGPAAVAIVHAGWRGIVAGVLEAGVAALRRIDRAGPVAAVIGPGVGPCCYEVGPDVAGRFELSHLRGRGLDLKRAAHDRLRGAGVRAVEDVARCTICERERFFSHRADGPVTGRQGGLVWRV